MDTRVKVALAGISGYGDSYLQALLPHEQSLNIKIVGAVDLFPQRCKRLAELQARSIAVYPSLDHLFARTAVDLMLIVTPIHLHAPQSCFALKHGANVLCEKPVAGTLEDAAAMLAAERSAKGFAAIGYQWSFTQPIQELKKDIIAGVLGKPIRMKALALFPRSLSYFRRNNWVGRKHLSAGDGVFDSPVNNATAHYLHNMFYLLGPTRETSAMPAQVEAELYRANDVENYDTAALRCRTEGGAEILFYTTLAAPDRQGPRSQYEFENATVEHDAASDGGKIVARFRDGRVKVYGCPNHDPDEKIGQCIDSVRSGVPVACGIPAAMAHVHCVAAAQQSPASIVDFPRDLCRPMPMDGETMIYVDGLQEALAKCYEQGILPGECADFTWAVRGTPIQVHRGNNGETPTAPVHHRRPSGAAASSSIALPA